MNFLMYRCRFCSYVFWTTNFHKPILLHYILKTRVTGTEIGKKNKKKNTQSGVII